MQEKSINDTFLSKAEIVITALMTILHAGPKTFRKLYPFDLWQRMIIKFHMILLIMLGINTRSLFNNRTYWTTRFFHWPLEFLLKWKIIVLIS